MTHDVIMGKSSNSIGEISSHVWVWEGNNRTRPSTHQLPSAKIKPTYHAKYLLSLLWCTHQYLKSIPLGSKNRTPQISFPKFPHYPIFLPERGWKHYFPLQKAILPMILHVERWSNHIVGYSLMLVWQWWTTPYSVKIAGLPSYVGAVIEVHTIYIDLHNPFMVPIPKCDGLLLLY